MSSYQTLTICDVAALLKIGEKTAYTMEQNGDPPGFEVQGPWRCRRSDINAWISEQADQARAESKEDET